MDEIKRMFCSKDCPDTCPFFASVSGKGLKVEPIKEQFLDKGFVCSKLKKFYKREVADNSDASFVVKNGKRIENPDVIDEFANLIKKHKNGRILFYRGSGSLGYYMGYWDKLFSGLDNVYFVKGSPCDETGIIAHIEDFGVCSNPPIENLNSVDSIVLFGKNALVTSPHLFAYLLKLKKSGKKIVYIDPIRSETAAIADEYLQIEPATDGILAHLILERLGYVSSSTATKTMLELIGITKADLDMLLDFIKPGSTGIIEGIGMQRYSNGKNSIQWVNRLAFYTKNLDTLYFSRPSKYGISPPVAAPKKRHVQIASLPFVLSAGLFDLIVIVAANPAVTLPENGALMHAFEEKKLVVVDTNITETARFADLFIRVGGMFAQEDVQGSYFFNKTHKRERLIEDYLTDIQLVRELADKLDINISPPLLDSITTDDKPAQREPHIDTIGLSLPLKSKGLRLVSLSSGAYLNSQTHISENEKIYISPQAAESRGIKNKDRVMVRSPIAHELFECIVTDKTRGNTAFSYKNRSLKVNALTPATPTDAKYALSYYDLFVDLEK